MSLLSYYPLNGDAIDAAMNYGVYINPNSLTYSDFGIGKSVNNDIIGKLQKYYNIYINEFSISFFYKFPAVIPIEGVQILSSTNIAIVCYSDKIQIYKGLQYIHGTSNPLSYDMIEYITLTPNTIQFFTISYDKTDVHLFMNGTFIQSIPNTTTNEVTTEFTIHNIGMVNNVWIYDEVLSDKLVMEMYKNKLFHYDFDVNVNLYPNMINRVRNGNVEEGILHWECSIDNTLEESYIFHENQPIKFFKLSRDIGTGVSMKQTIAGLDSAKSYWLTYNEFDFNANDVVHKEIPISNVTTYDVIITSSANELFVNEIMLNETQSISYITYIPPEYIPPEIDIAPCGLKPVEPSFELSETKPIWDKNGFYGDGSLIMENMKFIFPDTLRVEDGNYIIKWTFKFTEFAAVNTPLLLFNLIDLNQLSLHITATGLMIGTTNLNRILDLDVWYSFTIVIANGLEFKIYINDELVGTYTTPSKCNKIVNFGFNGELNCSGFLDEISMFYYPTILSDDEINDMYLDGELIAVIDNYGSIWAKAFNQRMDKPPDVTLSVDADRRILNLPPLREIGRNVRYIKVICDDTVNTIPSRFMEIARIECIVDGNIAKTIYGTYVTNESGELILAFDLGQVYNVEMFKVYFNAYTNTTEYVNKRISVSVDNIKWSSNYYPYDNNAKTEHVGIPTEFLLYDHIVHIDGDLNITNAHRLYKL